MEKENVNKEIDLFELLNRFYAIFIASLNFVLSKFLKFLRFNVKSIFYIIFFGVLAVGVGLYMTNDNNRPFDGDFLMEVNGAKSGAVADIVDVLAQKIDKETNARFASALGLNLSQVQTIQGLKTFAVIDLNNNRTRDYVDYDNSFVEDTLNSKMQNYLAIRIQTKGPADFNLIQKKIVEYLRADEYLKREEVERLKIINERIKAIELEIYTLEQLRMTQNGNDKLQFIGEGVVKETTYFNDMIALKVQKSSLQEQLNLQRNVVTIYSGVKVLSSYNDFKIYVYLLIASYFIALISSFLVSYRKKVYQVLVKS